MRTIFGRAGGASSPAQSAAGDASQTATTSVAESLTVHRHFDFKSKLATFWPGLMSATNSDRLLYLAGTISRAPISAGSLDFSPVAREARISTRKAPVPRPPAAEIAYFPPATVAQPAWFWPPVLGTKLMLASSSGAPSNVTVPWTVAPAGAQPETSVSATRPSTAAAPRSRRRAERSR